MALQKQIIVNGDDFGYSSSSNKGIVDAYRHGILTSTSVMANLLKGDERLVGLQSEINKPQIGIGIHLNLTFGKPLVPEVWSTKAFTRPYKGTGKPEEWQGSAWREYVSNVPRESILAEWRAQIVRVKQIFGAVDHLDSHQGIASYPPARELYEELAKEFGLAIRHISPLSETPVYGGDFLVDPGYADDVRLKGIRTTDREDMTYYHTRPDPIGAFCKALEDIKEGEVVEFMFHPASDATLGGWRVKDLNLLTNKKVMQAVKELDIKLTTYRDSAR